MAFILKRAQTGLGHIGEAVEGVRNLIWDDMIFCHVFIFLFFLYAFFFGCEYSLFILKKYIRVVSLCLLTMNDQVSRAHRRVFSTDLRTSSPPPLAVVPGKPTFDGPVRKRTIDIHIIANFFYQMNFHELGSLVLLIISIEFFNIFMIKSPFS